MLKTLFIPDYADGFINNGINCIDGIIACSTGYYEADYYYRYCLLYGLLTNWSTIFFPEDQCKILRRLGMDMIEHPISDYDSFIKQIEYNIQMDVPTLIIVDYYYLHYNKEYYKLLHTPHGIVINGYDKDRLLISIKENCHIDWKAPYYDFYISGEVLYKIFADSSRYFAENSKNFYHRISDIYYKPSIAYFAYTAYSVVKIEEHTHSTLWDAGLTHNSLFNAIDNYQHMKRLFKEYKMAAAQFRRNYTESVEMIIAIIHRYYQDESIAPYFEKYKLERIKIVSEIIIYAMRDLDIPQNRLYHLKMHLQTIDDEFLKSICKLFSRQPDTSFLKTIGKAE